MMHRRFAAILAAGTLALAAPALSQTITVRADGSGDHLTIPSAVAAVADGGTIQITEAGTYIEGVTLPGGKSYTIEATVPGVVSGDDSGFSGWSLDPSAGVVDVTLRGFEIRRIAGSGAAFDIDQHATNSVTVTFDDMDIRQTVTASGGEALKLDDGAGAGAAPIVVTATDSLFEALTESGSGKAAIRVQGDVDEMSNVTIELTNCTLTNKNEGCFRSDGDSNQTYTLTGCTLNNPLDKGFELATAQDGSTYTLVDTTILAGQEGVYVRADSVNNTWVFERCTIDNTAAFDTGGDKAVSLDYDTAGTSTDPAVANNTLSMKNCLILSQPGSGSNFRAVDLDNFNAASFLHCTIAAVGGTGDRAISTARSSAYDFQNCAFIDYADPISGSTGTKSGNAIAGPADDTSGGGDRIYTTNVGDFNLDAGYAPSPTSSLIDAGDADTAISTAVGGVDRAGATRDATPDIGAFEYISVSSVEDWRVIEK